MSSNRPPPDARDNLQDEVPPTTSPPGGGGGDGATELPALGNAEDLVDESAGKVPQAEPLMPKGFRPWHKPRKQFLREVQWCEEIASLIDELDLPRQARPLGYLSLPGDELLDIRAIHACCSAKGALLRFLGYNAIAEDPVRVTESRLSEAEVKSLPNIYAPSSVVLHDALEDVAIATTMAHKEARQHAPYDVINIDLCNGVANTKPQTRRSTLQAIRGLLEIQLSKGGSPWLLFLTTRIGRSLLDEDAQTLLHNRVSQNTSDASFCSAIDRDLGITKQDIHKEKNGQSVLSDDRLQRALSLGVCKWLLGLVVDSNTGWRITLLPSYSYQIGPKHPQDMVSFGFRIERNPAPMHDPSNLTVPVLNTPVPLTEPELAVAIVGQIAKIVDVDAHLREDDRLYRRMVDSHGELLAQARYEKEKYVLWVANGCRP